MLLPRVQDIDAVIAELMSDCKYLTFEDFVEHSMQSGEVVYFKVNADPLPERLMYHYLFHLGAAVEQYSIDNATPITHRLVSSAIIAGGIWILGLTKVLTEAYPNMQNELPSIQPFYAELSSAEANLDSLTEADAQQFSDCFNLIFEVCEDNLDDYTDDQFLLFTFSPLRTVTDILNYSITARRFEEGLGLSNEL